MKVWVEESDGKYKVKKRRLIGLTHTCHHTVLDNAIPHEEDLEFIDHLTAIKAAKKLAAEIGATYVTLT